MELVDGSEAFSAMDMAYAMALERWKLDRKERNALRFNISGASGETKSSALLVSQAMIYAQTS